MRISTRAMSRLRHSSILFLVLVATLFTSLYHRVTADVFWENCESPADHPDTVDGDYYNLCVVSEEFEGRSHSWKFTKGEIKSSKFTNCIFENRPSAPSNFTEATWSDVVFDGCSFGSIDIDYGKEMVFDKTTMTNVEFKNCAFDHTITLIFSDFLMNNVTFLNCSFKGDTIFTMGVMNKASIFDSMIMHSTETMTPGENESFTFQSVTINQLDVVGSHFVNPLRFQGVDAADVSVNDSMINEFHCHSDADKHGNIEYLTHLNDTALQKVEFFDKVVCDQTSWRGFYGGNITFYDNADFSKSSIYGLYWDEVKSVKKEGGECHELSFEESSIDRRVLANITVDCVANFKKTVFKTVFVRNFWADKPNFEDAMFIGQEYIDGQCCSVVCAPLKCLCNVSEPSGTCPAARGPINVTAPLMGSCFPGDATVKTMEGRVVTMEELAAREKIAVGGGEHSDVFFFGHRAGDVEAEYLRIEHTGSKAPLRMSESHYLYVNGALRIAGTVRAGDRLRGADGKDTVTVLYVSREKGQGMYAPTSVHGDLLVDGVVVSSYTDAIHPGLAHRLLYPLRLLYRYGLHDFATRFTLFEQRSWSNVARVLGIPRGPAVVEL